MLFEVKKRYLVETADNSFSFRALELGENGWIRARIGENEKWLNTNHFTSVELCPPEIKFLTDPNAVYHLPPGCLVCGTSNTTRCPECGARLCSKHAAHQHRLED
jgi:hypothetical protein